MAKKLSIYRAQVPVVYTCTLCDSGEDVHWYCNDCQETLCERCKEVHKRGKKTRNDKIVPVKEANPRTTEQMVLEECKHHRGKTCDLYCSECEEILCSVCTELHHKRHNWKHLENELTKKKKEVQNHLAELKEKLTHLKRLIGKNHQTNKDFVMNINRMCNEVQSQRSKLKVEVDVVADKILAGLSAIKEEEIEFYKQNCESSEKNVLEIQGLIEKTEEEIKKRTGPFLFELQTTLQTSVQLHDVSTEGRIFPEKPDFVPGVIDQLLLGKMIGHVTTAFRYMKKEINSTSITKLSTFKVQQETEVLSICSVSETHSWLAIYNFPGLVMVDTTGLVKESVDLDFNPWRLAWFQGTEILISNESEIHKMTEDKQVTMFANISPLKVLDISTKDNKEVFMCTGSSEILVLNGSGDVIRKLECESKAHTILCSSSSIIIGVGDYLPETLIIKDYSGKLLHTWTGEIDKCDLVTHMYLRKMACDMYDRVFIPDFKNDQLYVLSSDSVKARCVLGKRHRITQPTAVCIDQCGNLWIGCNDGSVHVLNL